MIHGTDEKGDYTLVLDTAMGIDGKCVLLDGHGNELPKGQDPVWLKFYLADCGMAKNSAGVLFDPNVEESSFERREYD